VTALFWSPQAERDVLAIRAYIAEGSSQYADLVVRRIVAGVERLADFPESGRIVPEGNDPILREVIVAPYRVVYRRGVAAIEIVTVFRASRLFPDLE
jgi:plasmid stabilization system protein ParE